MGDEADPNQALEALRALLYQEEPGHNTIYEINKLLTSWTDPETLPIAVAYVMEPLERLQAPNTRCSPQVTWMQAQASREKPLTYPMGHDPRLALCDAYTWREDRDDPDQQATWGARSPLRNVHHLTLEGAMTAKRRPAHKRTSLKKIHRVLSMPCWCQVEALYLKVRPPNTLRLLKKLSYPALRRVRSLYTLGFASNSTLLLYWLQRGELPWLETVSWSSSELEGLLMFAQQANMGDFKTLQIHHSSSLNPIWEALLTNPTLGRLSMLKSKLPAAQETDLLARIRSSALRPEIKASLGLI